MTVNHPIVPGVRFKDIADFPGYCVGDDGSVWSRYQLKHLGNRAGCFSFLSDAWKMLSHGFKPGKHHMVTLCREGKKYNRLVHRLVLEAFVGPPPAHDGPGRMEACHFPDRDPANNRLENLRWDTSKANQADAIVHGTKRRGVANNKAKLDDEAVREIRRLRDQGASLRKVAALFGVTRGNVNFIHKRKTWAHVQ